MENRNIKPGVWQVRNIVATDGNYIKILRCSKCKSANVFPTNYCPNRGTPMVQEEKEEAE